MHFGQYFSSSSGNLYAVTNRCGQRLMIECGVPWKKLQRALGYDLRGIDACLLSHAHADHSKAVKEVLQAGINVYTSQGTLTALGIEGERRVRPVEPGKAFFLDGFTIYPFQTHHDAVCPLGFLVSDTDTSRSLLFATDTSHITQRFTVPFNVVAIEASYDRDMLQERVDTGVVNETLAKRLLGSHMEWRVTERYLAEFCDLSRCEQIHLLHLSADNIDKAQVRRHIEDRFFIETVTA